MSPLPDMHGSPLFGRPPAHWDCKGCGRSLSPAERQRKGLGIYCSLECAAASRRRCNCDEPIVITEEDGERHCFACSRPLPDDVGVGRPRASQRSHLPGGSADSGAGAGFTASTPSGSAPDDFDITGLMEEAA